MRVTEVVEGSDSDLLLSKKKGKDVPVTGRGGP
jgi:hypothetical protein